MSCKRRIRVLFVLHSFGTGGSEKVVFDLCKRLNRNFFEPFVVSLYDGLLRQEFVDAGIWSLSLSKRPGVDWGLMRNLLQVVREKSVDLINAHHFSPFIHSCLASFMTHSQLLYTDHTVNEIFAIPGYWVIIGRLLLSRCYGVIGISEDCSLQLKSTFHLPSQKIFTILNAVDLDNFGQTIDKLQKRNELNIAPSEPIIGIVGNLREQKNHQNIIRAMKVVTKQYPRAKLLIIGEGSLLDNLQSLSRQLGVDTQVLFLGSRLDTADLYQIMDVYCLCSHYEGLPLTILEAMASKVPFVGTDVPGIRDVIVDGRNGLLVEPNNPQKLGEAIIKLLNDEQGSSRLSTNGFEYVHEHHDIVPWVRTYEDLFVKAFRERIV